MREFSKNLQELKAHQGKHDVPLTQLDKHRWRADCSADKPLVLTYAVCAYDTSVRTAWLDASRGFFNGTAPLVDGKINSFLNAAGEGLMMRPSSLHPNGVNAIFVGGNGKFIAQTIDMGLYAQLLSWDGSRKGQAIVSDTDF